MRLRKLYGLAMALLISGLSCPVALAQSAMFAPRSRFGKPRLRGLFVTIAILAAFSSLATAQSTMGTITGIVTDSSGAVVVGANVSAQNLATGVATTTSTSSTGNYSVPNLWVGTYTIQVTVAGFKSWSRAGIALESNETLRVDAVLEVGALQERLMVIAAAPVLKSESTEISSTLENHLTEDLPLSMGSFGSGMRSAFGMMLTLPQVKTANGQTDAGDFMVSGGQASAFQVSVDGLSVEMGWRNKADSYMSQLVPPNDAIQEFRVDTATFRADESRASGGLFTVVTKSGTNKLHGSAFDYYQSQRLNANTWQNNEFGRPRAILHRNDFGVTAGGPVYIPKLYNGRDKSFFFFDFEGFRYPQTSNATLLTVPTPAMIQGDFSQWKTASGALIPIYDPTTTQSNGAGGFVRQPFPGNVIPASELSPISKAITQYYPAPNLPGFSNNWLNTSPGPTKAIQNMFMAKGDQYLGSKQRLAFTFTRSSMYSSNAYDSDPTNPLNYGGSALPYPLNSDYLNGAGYFGQVFRLNYTYTIKPNLVNSFTAGYDRLHNTQHSLSAYVPNHPNWCQTLGGIKNNPSCGDAFPAVSFATDNYTGWYSTYINDPYHNTYNFDDNLSWVKGAHTFKFGYLYQMIQYDKAQCVDCAGNLTFNRLETAAPGVSNGTSGSAFGSFMLGAVDNAYFRSPSPIERRWPYHAFYLQDDWKVTSKLTINAGLRFEIEMPPYEKRNRLAYLDATLPNPAADGYPGALVFLGNGPGRSGQRTMWGNSYGYGPRVGLAYQVDQKTVVRAGAGIYYDASKVMVGTSNDAQPGFSALNSFASTNQGITPAFYWDNGWPAWTPPTPNAGYGVGVLGCPNTQGCDVVWYQTSDLEKMPTYVTWSVAVSRQFVRGFVVDATYTGTKGTHLPSERPNYMQVNPKYAYLGSLLNKSITDPGVVALGFTPPFANFTSVLGANATLGQSLRMFPQYLGVDTGGMMNHSGNSTYHALMLKLSKRYSDGLSLEAAYTFSKQLTDSDDSEPWIEGTIGAGVRGGAAQNSYDLRAEKTYSVLDMPQMFKLTEAYDLPLGKGRHFATSGPLRLLLGGWTVSSYGLYQSGYPLGVIDTGYQNNLFGGTSRPNVLTNDWLTAAGGSCSSFDPNVNGGLFLNASAFARRTNPSLDPFGNSPPLNGNARSCPIKLVNMSIIREFSVKEKAHLNFRWEIYDLLNNKRWNQPQSLDLANALFGKVNNATGNRTMQAALKLVF